MKKECFYKVVSLDDKKMDSAEQINMYPQRIIQEDK